MDFDSEEWRARVRKAQSGEEINALVLELPAPTEEQRLLLDMEPEAMLHRVGENFDWAAWGARVREAQSAEDLAALALELPKLIEEGKRLAGSATEPEAMLRPASR